MRLLSKRLFLFVTFLFLIRLFPLNAMAQSTRVFDFENVLSNSHIEQLELEISNIQKQFDHDVAIVTQANLNGKSSQEYADDFYDENHLGLTSELSGILLLINLADQEVYLSTTGEAISYFPNQRISKLIDEITPSLSAKDYDEATRLFVNSVRQYLSLGIPNGQYEEMERTPIQAFWMRLLTCGLVASVITLVFIIYVLTSYKPSKRTNHFYDQNVSSVVISKKVDQYLRSNVTKTPLPKNDDDSMKSSTHTSSSGQTHGGGGGKF
ncbi:MAG: TPM domain-containing protein [Turicibacter sp.]